MSRRGEAASLHPEEKETTGEQENREFLFSATEQWGLGSQRLVLNVAWWCDTLALLSAALHLAVVLGHVPELPSEFKPMVQLSFGSTLCSQ